MNKEQVPANKRWANRYSYAFKMEVIGAVQNGQISENQAQRKYGVHRKTIHLWIKKFGNLEKNYSDMGSKSPKEEIVELKAKLRALKTENETLKEVMQIIQEEFGETVVKKYLPGLPKEMPAKKTKESK